VALGSDARPYVGSAGVGVELQAFKGSPALARVYDALGSRDSAIAVYERYLRVRALSRTSLDAYELGNALERLAALHEASGDRSRAAECYARSPTCGVAPTHHFGAAPRQRRSALTPWGSLASSINPPGRVRIRATLGGAPDVTSGEDTPRSLRADT